MTDPAGSPEQYLPQNSTCWKCGKPLYGIVPCAMCMSDATAEIGSLKAEITSLREAGRELAAALEQVETLASGKSLDKLAPSYGAIEMIAHNALKAWERIAGGAG